MKCIRAFSCSCLNDTMAAFRCFSTGWCCKMLCFQCWFRRFLENTTVKPTTVYLQRWHSQRAGKKDLPKYNHIRIDVVREKDIYLHTHTYMCINWTWPVWLNQNPCHEINICLIILILVLFSFTYIPSSFCCKKKPSYHLHVTVANPTSHSRVQCGNFKPHLSSLCF